MRSSRKALPRLSRESSDKVLKGSESAPEYRYRSHVAKRASGLRDGRCSLQILRAIPMRTSCPSSMTVPNASKVIARTITTSHHLRGLYRFRPRPKSHEGRTGHSLQDGVGRHRAFAWATRSAWYSRYIKRSRGTWVSKRLWTTSYAFVSKRPILRPIRIVYASTRNSKASSAGHQCCGP